MLGRTQGMPLSLSECYKKGELPEVCGLDVEHGFFLHAVGTVAIPRLCQGDVEIQAHAGGIFLYGKSLYIFEKVGKILAKLL